MATIYPTWNENNTLRTGTLLAAATDTNDIDLNTLNADMLVLTTNITIGSASGVTIEIFGSTDSGTTDSTVPIYSQVVNTSSILPVQVKEWPYIAVKLTNEDGSNPVTDVTVKYAWRQWTSV